MTGPITSLTPAPLSTVTAQTPLSAGFPSPPSFDVIELLPEHAQNRLRQLRLRATEAHRLVPEFEQMREASMARVEAENQLKQLQAHPQEFGRGLPEAHPLVVTAEKHLDKMTADLKRLQERSEMRAQAWQAASVMDGHTARYWRTMMDRSRSCSRARTVYSMPLRTAGAE